jgi:hypothetical protein
VLLSAAAVSRNASASRRVKVALAEGYLINAEDKKGRPTKLTVGEPLPAERRVLPTPAEVEEYLTAIPAINTATLGRG